MAYSFNPAMKETAKRIIVCRSHFPKWIRLRDPALLRCASASRPSRPRAFQVHLDQMASEYGALPEYHCNMCRHRKGSPCERAGVTTDLSRHSLCMQFQGWTKGKKGKWRCQVCTASNCGAAKFPEMAPLCFMPGHPVYVQWHHLFPDGQPTDGQPTAATTATDAGHRSQDLPPPPSATATQPPPPSTVYDPYDPSPAPPPPPPPTHPATGTAAASSSASSSSAWLETQLEMSPPSFGTILTPQFLQGVAKHRDMVKENGNEYLILLEVAMKAAGYTSC